MAKRDNDRDETGSRPSVSVAPSAPSRPVSSGRPSSSSPTIYYAPDPNSSARDTRWDGYVPFAGSSSGNGSVPVNQASPVRREPTGSTAVKPDVQPRKRVGSNLKVTTRQLERSGIASRPVSKTRTDSARDVRGKKSTPEKQRDAKRRAEPKSVTAARSSPVEKGARQKNIHDDADWKDVSKKAVNDRAVVKKQLAELKKEPLRCKERPKDNRPKKGGGGGRSREFIPWC